MTKSDKSTTNSKWVSTEQTRRNHEDIFKKEEDVDEETKKPDSQKCIPTHRFYRHLYNRNVFFNTADGVYTKQETINPVEPAQNFDV